MHGARAGKTRNHACAFALLLAVFWQKSMLLHVLQPVGMTHGYLSFGMQWALLSKTHFPKIWTFSSTLLCCVSRIRKATKA
jgi:hypothetical protein